MAALNAVLNAASGNDGSRGESNTAAQPVPRAEPLVIGSVKTNFGHLEGAAGIAGLIKACLCFHHQAIPPHLHFEQPSSRIDWNPNLKIPTELRPWPHSQQPRFAGVSSFGFGGTNAHVVLGEAPPLPTAQPQVLSKPALTGEVVDRPLLTLSAKSHAALSELAKRHADCLAQLESNALGDYCFTANVGRTPFDYRLAVWGDSPTALATSLREWAEGMGSPPCVTAKAAPSLDLVWHFANDLTPLTCDRLAPISQSERFVSAIENLMNQFPSCRSLSVEDVLGRSTRCLSATESAAAHFCVQLAVAGTWQTLGVNPTGITAAGLGEYAAACVAGVITKDEAVRLIEARQSESAERLREVTTAIHYRDPETPYRTLGALSSDGHAVTDAEYWYQHALVTEQPPALPASVVAGDRAMCLDMGDGRLFGGENRADELRSPSAHKQDSLNSVLARLWVSGIALHWRAITPAARRTANLPRYPFERKRHWYQPEGPQTSRPQATPEASPVRTNGRRAEGSEEKHLLVPLDLATRESVFECDLADLPYLQDHLVGGQAVLPMAGFLELAWSAGHQTLSQNVAVVELSVQRPLEIAPNRPTTVQIVLTPTEDPYRCDCRIMARTSIGWTEHATCTIEPAKPSPLDVEDATPVAEIANGPAEPVIEVDPDELYKRLQLQGIEHGKFYQVMRKLRVIHNDAWGELEAIADPPYSYHLHPALLDGCLQALAGYVDEDADETWLPASVNRYEIDPSIGQHQRLAVSARKIGDGARTPMQFDLQLHDLAGHRLGRLRGVRLTKIPSPRSQLASDRANANPTTSAVVRELMAAADVDRPAIAARYLHHSIAEIMGLELGEIAHDARLDHLGLDSMMAMEIQQEIEETLGANMEVTQFLQGITLTDLSRTLVDQVMRLNPDGGQAALGAQKTQRYVEGAI